MAAQCTMMDMYTMELKEVKGENNAKRNRIWLFNTNEKKEKEKKEEEVNGQSSIYNKHY